ncbi:MAG: prolyl oligopeptidase family serine peptidase [Azospirillaceae bacterium]|nr:prolyl oligopeptidase family serine peptidase [Azospirillaceae bacterium]
MTLARDPVIFDALLGKLWLERGGIRVVATIRGGAEFGASWHKAGCREGRRLAHDDFAAVAADLIRRGVTSPGRIAGEGASNTGILVANMLTRYPERFGAILCTIPVIDMRRFRALSGAAPFVDEYGDPDSLEDWTFMAKISAYHTAEPGKSYPPILICTNRRDDRVHCGHGRKMAAKLQAMGYTAYFYEEEAGGHAHGQNSADVATFFALGHRFLRHVIGWEAE